MSQQNHPASAKGWRAGAGRGSEKRGSRFSKRTIRGALIAVVVGSVAGLGLLAWRYWPSSLPRYLALWVSEYEDPRIAPDVTMGRDYQALAEAVGLPKGGAPGLEWDWKKALQGLDRGESLVLFVSAYACTGPGGEVYLLRPQVLPTNLEDSLTLREVLEALGSCRAENKLLVLDLMRPISDPYLGLIDDDVAAAVHSTVLDMPEARCLVLSSCSPGQTSQVSEVLGRSVFSFFVEQGLRGAADEVAGGNPDKVVSVRELAAYVNARTDAWASHNRGVRQEPRLVAPGGSDFVLAHVQNKAAHADAAAAVVAAKKAEPAEEKAAETADGKAPEAVAEKTSEASKTSEATAKADASKVGSAEQVPTYPRGLEEGWKRYEVAWKSGAYRDAPARFRRVGAALARSERDWRHSGTPAAEWSAPPVAGLVAEEERPPGGEAAGAVLAAKRRLAIPQPETPRSIGLRASLDGPAADPALAEVVRAWVEKQLVARRAAPPDGLPPPLTAAADAFFTENKSVLDADPSGYLLASAIRDTMILANGDRLPGFLERLEFVLPLIRGHKPDALGARFLEMRLLEDIAALGKGAMAATPAGAPGGAGAPGAVKAPWSDETLGEAFRVVSRAEKAEAYTPAFRWLRAALDRAGAARHTAEIMLRAPGYARESELRSFVADAGTAYSDLERAKDHVETTLALLDESTAVVNSLVEYVEASESRELRALWSDAIGATRAAQKLLDDFEAGDLPELDEALQSVNKRLRGLLSQLKRPFDADVVQGLIGRASGRAEAAAYRELDAVLLSPLLSAEDRVRLCEVGRDLAQRLHQGTPDQPPQGREPARQESARDRAMEARAGRSVELLGSGGTPAEGVTAAIAKLAAESPGTAATRFAVGKAVRDAWFRSAAAVSEGLEAQDRLSRILPPFPESSSGDDPERNPTRDLRNQKAREQWSWLASRYRYQERVLGALVSDVGIYREASDDCMRNGTTAARRAPEPSLELGPTGPTSVVLSTENPRATVSFRVTNDSPNDSGNQEVELRASTPDDRLVLSGVDGRFNVRPGSPEVRSLGIEFRPAAGAGGGAPGPRTEGVLILARADNRVYPITYRVEGSMRAEPVQLLLSTTGVRPRAQVRELFVRPLMAEQRVGLYLRNPAPVERNVELEVWANGARLPGSVAKLAIAPLETKRVEAFEAEQAPAPAAPAAAAAPAGGQAVPAPAEAKLKRIELGDPGTLEFRLRYDDAARPFVDVIPVQIVEPTEYVAVANPRFDPAAGGADGNRLSLTVASRRPELDPPSRADLVVNPRDIPRLTENAKVAQTHAELPGAVAAPTELFASALALGPSRDEQGSFYLDVDDYPRALKFETNFALRGRMQPGALDQRPAIRGVLAGTEVLVEGVPKAVSSAQAFAVTVEVDNAPRGGRVEVGLESARDGGHARPVTRPAKRRYLGVAADPAGVLVLEGSVTDPEVPLDVRGLRDKRWLVVRLLDADGKPLDQTRRELIFDNGPPEGIRILDLPTGPVKPGLAQLPVRASGRSVSGIESVRFFLGEPAKGAPPAGAALIRAEPGNADATIWRAAVPLSGKEEGPVAISVEMINGVGISGFATETVTFERPPAPVVAQAKNEAPPEPPKPGKIRGTLKEAWRPQPGLDVVLIEGDEQGKLKEKSRAKTTPDGRFEFSDLAPGTYRLQAASSASKSAVQRDVTVGSGQTVEVELGLSR